MPHKRQQWNDPWCNCKKQEYQDFNSLKLMICDTSTISVKVRVLLKEMFSSWYRTFLLTSLTINIPWSLFQILRIFLNSLNSYPEHNNNEILTTCTISIFIFQKRVHKWVFPENKTSKIRFLKLTNDKLINQMFYKYVRRICLIILINTKCQQVCWPWNLFAHRLHCTVVYL